MKSLQSIILMLIFSSIAHAANATCEQYISQNVSAYYIADYNSFLQSNSNSKNISALQDRLKSLNDAILSDSARGNNTDADFDRCMSQAYTDAINKIESPGLALNPSQHEKKENSSSASTHYPAPRGRCIAWKVEGESIMVMNHCDVPIVGQFCFIHSQTDSCADSTAGSFGPVDVGSEVMIATTAGTNPRGNELKYVLCNADAAEHDQCHTHHPR